MKRFLCKSASYILLILICICCCSCNKNNNIKTKMPDIDAQNENSDISVENSKYSLSWDNEYKTVYLADKENNTLLSSALYLPDKSINPDYCDVLSIEYFNSTAGAQEILTAKSNKDNCSFSSKKTKNGFSVTVLFEDLKILVPFSVTLNDSSVDVSVDIKNIVESSKFRVYRVCCLPYFCSCQNSINNYYVIPDGNGALMKTDERGIGNPRSYEASVYGTDLSQEILEKTSNTKDIKMAFFGMSADKVSVASIITNGSEQASISAFAGDKSIGNSYANFYFQIRGFKKTKTPNGYSHRFTDEKIKNEKVSFSMKLSDAYTDYVKICGIYREYLKDNYKMSTIKSDTPLSIRFLGALTVKDFVFGVPYSKVEKLTSFNDVKSILKEIKEKTDVIPDVQMVGFGESGLDTGKISGGFGFTDVVGSKEDLSSLLGYVGKNGINCYFDFDVVNFSKSSSGFSKTFQNAITCNKTAAVVPQYYLSTYDADKDNARLLSRKCIKKAVDKTISFIKKQKINAVSLSSLSKTAYSDYKDNSYYVKGNMIKDVRNSIDTLSKNKISFASNNSYDYVTASAKRVFEVSTDSSEYNCFDEEVPLYQIVFKGYIPLSSYSVNLSGNPQKQFLKSLECGTSISFTLIGNYKTEFATTYNSAIISSLYSDNKNTIFDMVNKSSKYLKNVEKATIISHSILENNVHKTEFDNGTTIYVNYSNDKNTADGISIKPMDFTVVGK